MVPRGLSAEAVQDGQDEGRGLAAARHRAGQEVAALEGGRDGLLLDGGGPGEAELADAAQQVGVEAEVGKGHGGRVLSAIPACWSETGDFAGEAAVRAAPEWSAKELHSLTSEGPRQQQDWAKR